MGVHESRRQKCRAHVGDLRARMGRTQIVRLPHRRDAPAVHQHPAPRPVPRCLGTLCEWVALKGQHLPRYQLCHRRLRLFVAPCYAPFTPG